MATGKRKYVHKTSTRIKINLRCYNRLFNEWKTGIGPIKGSDVMSNTFYINQSDIRES